MLTGQTAGTPAAEQPVATKPEKMVDRLITAVKRDLRRKQPTGNVVIRKCGESLFDGSFDWHSNLLAHWCLLTHARRTKDQELQQWVMAPLTKEALAEERLRVNELPLRFVLTFPYDQAWLLLFLAELERHQEDPAATREFRIEVEERVIDWLEKSIFPDLPPKLAVGRLEGRTIGGWYRSWAWNWYQVKCSQPIGKNSNRRLKKLWKEHLVPNLDKMLAETETSLGEFLSVPALAFLINDVEPFGRELALPALVDGHELPDDVTIRDCHEVGVWISRLWPLAIAARKDPAARAKLDKHLARMMAREDLWHDGFLTVSHWVPQYLWMTLALAEPR